MLSMSLFFWKSFHSGWIIILPQTIRNLLPIHLNTPRCSASQFLLQLYVIFFPSMAKNASQFVNQKLFHSCKYFLRNRKFIIFENFSSRRSSKYFNINEIPPIIWVTDNAINLNYTAIYSVISRKLCHVHVKELCFAFQIITYNDFRFLVFSGKILTFDFQNCSIKHNDGSWVPLGDILEKLPRVGKFI